MKKIDLDAVPATALAEHVVELFVKWESYIRSNRWERHPEHMDQVKAVLGPRPTNDRPGSLAMWVAAVINPLPPLGAAEEIRPRVLAAKYDLERLAIVASALETSIKIVKKKRGTVELFGLEIDIQIILFGAFGLLIGSFVQGYCRRIFVEFGFDRALLGVHGV